MENRAVSRSRRLLGMICLALVAPLPAHALDGGAWTVQKGGWYTELGSLRGSANRIFLRDFRDVAIPFEGRAHHTSWTSYNEIGWRKGASFVLHIPFETTTFRFLDETRTISGLSDLETGLRIKLRDGDFGMILDAGWLAPLGYNKNVVPSLGDGRHKVFGALNAGLRLASVPAFVQGAKGFLFISEDGLVFSYSHVDLAGWIGSALLIGARYADFRVWSTSFEIDAQGQSYSAGPVLSVRVDERIMLTAGAMRDWYGRNSLARDQVYVSIGFQQSGPGPVQGFLGGPARP